MNCSAVLYFLSQFFHSRRCFSSHAKLRSTIQRLGIIANVCNSLRLTICTVTSSLKLPLPHRQTACRYTLHHTKCFLLLSTHLYCAQKRAMRHFVTLAAVMARACGKPCVSTAMCRFIPDIFLPASYPCPSALSVFLTLCASTISKLLLQDVRPCFIRAWPINFF